LGFLKANYLGGPTEEFGGNPTPRGAPATDFHGTANFKRFTPCVSLSYKPTPDHMLYATFSEGFKGGGFDPPAGDLSAIWPCTPPGRAGSVFRVAGVFCRTAKYMTCTRQMCERELPEGGPSFICDGSAPRGLPHVP